MNGKDNRANRVEELNKSETQMSAQENEQLHVQTDRQMAKLIIIIIVVQAFNDKN